MSEQTNRHPYLEGLNDDSVHRQVLWGTGIPVFGLLEHNEETEPVVEAAVPATEPPVARQTGMPVMAASDEMLSPFARWLTELKPSSRYDSIQEPPDIPVIPMTPEEAGVKAEEVRKKKKKDKKKRKKDKGKKSAKPRPEISDLSRDIASDTLAELIVNQGHIDEAILMYEKLVHLHPERAEFYSARITELKNKASG